MDDKFTPRNTKRKRNQEEVIKQRNGARHKDNLRQQINLLITGAT